MQLDRDPLEAVLGRAMQFGDIVTGVFTPVLAKHSKSFSLIDCISAGVDRMQRNFEPMRKQVESWRAQQPPAEAAKLATYRAFVEGDLEVPRHLARRVHVEGTVPVAGVFRLSSTARS